MTSIENQPTDTPTNNEKFVNDEDKLTAPLIEKSRVTVFGIITLNPGVSALNYISSIFFTMMMFFSFNSAATLSPLILVSENHYHIPQESSGTYTGILLLVELIVRTIVSVPYGKISDRMGRRPMVIYGMSSIFASFVLIATQTNIYTGLILARVLLGNGIAALHAVPLLADYVSDESKGKAGGISGITVGLTTLMSNLYLKALFKNHVELTYCFISVGAICISITLLASIGLKAKIKEEDTTTKDSAASVQGFESTSFIDTFKEAIQTLNANVWLLIAFVLQVLGSADFYIFTTFMTLFVKSMFPKGTPDNEANLAVNNVQTWMLVPTIIPSVVYGLVLDKTNKAVLMIYIALFGTIGAFLTLAMATHPQDWNLFIGAMFVGLSVPGIVICMGTLNNKHFPAEKRGLMQGFTNMVGNLGFAASTFTSGLLYDHWQKNGPFILVAGLLTFAAILIAIIHKVRG